MIVCPITCLLTQESTTEALPRTICSSEEKTPFTTHPTRWLNRVGKSSEHWHFAKSVKVTEHFFVEIKKKRFFFTVN